jgi:hypothetical protein
MDWYILVCAYGFSMCLLFLKSKCFAMKLKCCVGDPDRYWNIGSKRCCALYLTSTCWDVYYWSKEGLVVYIWVHGCSKENFCLICVRKSLRSLVFISKSHGESVCRYGMGRTCVTCLVV